MRKIIIVLFCLLMVACSTNNNGNNKKPPINKQEDGGIEVDNITYGLEAGWNDSLNKDIEQFGIPYQIYLPEDYSQDKKYPVLLYLHGNGSRGTDNFLQFQNAQICNTFISNDEQKDIIMIAPQCDKTMQWVEADHTAGNYILQTEISYCLQEALNIFDYWTDKLSCDNNRFYLFGNSMGGFACYDLICRYEDKWACAVVVAGCGVLNKVDIIKNTPLWIHHGTADTLVPYEGSLKMYEALKAAGANDNVTLTTYEGEGHTIFKEVGMSKEVADWIYKQQK